MTAITAGYGDLYPVTIEEKSIATAVMVLGIDSIGIFISTIGASLIESRLKEKGKERNNNDSYTKLGLKADTKLLIKSKIDDIENLTEDVNTLTAIIRTLHSSLHKNSMI